MASRVKDERAPEPAGFRDVQRLAYACAEAVAARLKPGVTERDAARMQREWLRARGVRDWFHLPFAWFGDRTAFTGFKVPLQFFPTNRELEPGMPPTWSSTASSSCARSASGVRCARSTRTSSAS